MTENVNPQAKKDRVWGIWERDIDKMKDTHFTHRQGDLLCVVSSMQATEWSWSVWWGDSPIEEINGGYTRLSQAQEHVVDYFRDNDDWLRHLPDPLEDENWPWDNNQCIQGSILYSVKETITRQGESVWNWYATWGNLKIGMGRAGDLDRTRLKAQDFHQRNLRQLSLLPRTRYAGDGFPFIDKTKEIEI